MARYALIDPQGVVQNIIELIDPAKYPLDPGWTVAPATAATARPAPIPEQLPSTDFRSLLQSSGSHIAARAAGTYGLGQGDPLALTGVGIPYPLNIVYLDPAEYPEDDKGRKAKLRIRATFHTNAVAPGGNYTIGLHPVTRPASGGGAGLLIQNIGAAVAGSTAIRNAPPANNSSMPASGLFDLPPAGFYAIGVVTTAAVAANALVHISAALQIQYL